MFFQKNKIKVVDFDKLIVRKSFRMFYGNGEIWCEDLDALSIYTDFVKEKFLLDMKSISRPSFPSLVAMNLNETLVTEELSDTFAENFQISGKNVTRVVYTGVDYSTKKLIMNSMRKFPPQYIFEFINDFEKAKEWLVH